MEGRKLRDQEIGWEGGNKGSQEDQRGLFYLEERREKQIKLQKEGYPSHRRKGSAVPHSWKQTILWDISLPRKGQGKN